MQKEGKKCTTVVGHEDSPRRIELEMPVMGCAARLPASNFRLGFVRNESEELHREGVHCTVRFWGEEGARVIDFLLPLSHSLIPSLDWFDWVEGYTAGFLCNRGGPSHPWSCATEGPALRGEYISRETGPKAPKKSSGRWVARVGKPVNLPGTRPELHG